MGHRDVDKTVTKPPRNEIHEAAEKWTLDNHAVYAAKCSDAQTPSFLISNSNATLLGRSTRLRQPYSAGLQLQNLATPRLRKLGRP